MTYLQNSSINSIAKYEFVNLGLMLFFLHLALHQPNHNYLLISALLLSHIGFFLLWQPALNGSQNVKLKTLATIFLFNSLLYFFLRDWFLASWIILLVGLTAGSALVNGLHRSLYALATVILFLELSLVLTPELFKLGTLDQDIENFIFYSLGFLCCIIMFWPTKKNRCVKVDYLHSILISFGLFSFYTASILISFTNDINYLQSLLMTSLSIAVFFILLSIIWLPRHGIAGIGQIWEQHILNIGNPFENWVKQTSLLGENKKITPDLFLDNSIQQLLTLSWVSGIYWADDQQAQLYGIKSKHYANFFEQDIKITLYSHVPMGSALKIHAQLLMHLMNYFYQSKLREITLKNQTHLKAVYETGSKLTHDIKNILQSLQVLTGVVQVSNEPLESHQLIEKQLPILTQRLQNTLDKLQAKTDTGRSFKTMDIWWRELQSRYHGRDIQFQGCAPEDISIDSDVFDSVLENLLENARSKRQIDPDTQIITCVKVTEKHIEIKVCDTGFAVPEAKSQLLFKQILPSKDGYGIGLYQCAQLASRNGYKLELVQNVQTEVCFQLSSI